MTLDISSCNSLRASLLPLPLFIGIDDNDNTSAGRNDDDTTTDLLGNNGIDDDNDNINWTLSLKPLPSSLLLRCNTLKVVVVMPFG